MASGSKWKIKYISSELRVSIWRSITNVVCNTVSYGLFFTEAGIRIYVNYVNQFICSTGDFLSSDWRISKWKELHTLTE